MKNINIILFYVVLYVIVFMLGYYITEHIDVLFDYVMSNLKI